MGKKNYVLGRIDPYVVTGFGQTGTIKDGSMLLVEIISLDCGHIELLPIFGPEKTDGEIEKTVELLLDAGFKFESLHHIAATNNTHLCKLVEAHRVNPKLIVALNLPIYSVPGEGVWIGSSRSEAPVL
jgi:hypothetical protein